MGCPPSVVADQVTLIADAGSENGYGGALFLANPPNDYSPQMPDGGKIIPPFGTGYTFLDKGLFMFNSSPNLTMCNSGATSFPFDSGVCYNVHENEGGILEFNAYGYDLTDPQTECQMDFHATGGIPSLSCVGGISSGSISTGLVSIFDPSGLPNRRTWWVSDDGVGDLHFYMIYDDESGGSDAFDIVSNSSNRVDHIEFHVPVVFDQGFSFADGGTCR